MIYFVVSPNTIDSVCTKARKSYKKTRRTVRRRYINVKKYGIFHNPPKRNNDDDFINDTSFYTDKMLSESENESDNDQDD